MNGDRHKPLPEHLPLPSFGPPVLAVGLMLLLWGAVTNWIVSVLGLVIAAFGCRTWLRDR
jgi:hypothetical protein